MEKIMNVIQNQIPNLKNWIIGIMTVIILCMTAVIIYQDSVIKDFRSNIVETTTDTKIFYINRVIYDKNPKVVEKTFVRYEKDYLNSVNELNDTSKVEVIIPIETTTFTNTLYQDNDTITYNAHVSGHKANLDSISFDLKYPKTIIHTTKNIINNNKKISIKHGPQIGVGYGVLNKKVDVFAGYGFQLTF